MEILSIKDNETQLKLLKVKPGFVELKVTVSYNFLISYQRTWYNTRFSVADFHKFVACLVVGTKSWHGHSNIWQTNKVFIKKRNHPFQYREVRFYRRFFVLGFNLVPATLSGVLISALSEVDI